MQRLLIIFSVIAALHCTSSTTITIPDHSVMEDAVMIEKITAQFLLNRNPFNDVDANLDFYILCKRAGMYRYATLNPHNVSTSIDRKMPTFLIIGPRFSGISDAWMMEFGRPLYDIGNVIVVDWQRYSMLDAGLWLQYVVQIGRHVARFVGRQCDSISLKRLTLFGHGDGAHIAGVVGKALRGEVDQIVALDPINPAFDTFYRHNPKACLQKSDANWVQIICTTKMYGTNDLDAHSIWTVNGGNIQPQCQHDLRWKRLRCSHVWAVGYYLESLDKRVELCDDSNTQRFGYWAPRLTGCFNLHYNPNKPDQTKESCWSGRKTM